MVARIRSTAGAPLAVSVFDPAERTSAYSGWVALNAQIVALVKAGVMLTFPAGITQWVGTDAAFWRRGAFKALTCRGIFPPSSAKVRPKEGTDDEADDTNCHLHSAGA